MAVTVRISRRWRYRGRASGKGKDFICHDLDHARNLVRKVIREHREFEKEMADWRRKHGFYNTRTRNEGAAISYISVKPEGTQPGDIVDVWTPERSWHKGRVGRDGLATSIPAEQEQSA